MTLPKHIAIIMDGNGRWAAKKKLPRIMGHHAGVKSVSNAVETCSKMGIKALTLFAFSTENWSRSADEVSGLMKLLTKNLHEKIIELKKNEIKFNVIGQIDQLPSGLQDEIKKAKEITSDSKGLLFTLALNYGARQEIVDAVKNICKDVESGALDIAALEENQLGDFLYTKDMPDPDLVIRTSGEVRLSNFLLWQTAYSELYFTETLWPDFDGKELEKAINDYSARERRFGG